MEEQRKASLKDETFIETCSARTTKFSRIQLSKIQDWMCSSLIYLFLTFSNERNL